jgi:DNA-binding response OmpR family regulator
VRVLVVEDDDRVGAALTTVLTHHGFDPVRARTGTEALALAPDCDIVLLDLGLPDVDGLEVCARVRRGCDVPIVAVTARADIASRLHALDLGADDYLSKPYDLRELVARIHAVARRTGSGRTDPAADGPVTVGDVVIDLAGRTVSVAGHRVPLTRKEFDVLALLAGRPGLVFRREQILSAVWGAGWQGAGHSLEVHVASLRAKLARPGTVETVRGVGYRLAV